jgi:hypothetical protein
MGKRSEIFLSIRLELIVNPIVNRKSLLLTLGLVNAFGLWFCAHAIYVTGLDWDMEAIKALAWSRMCILLIHLIPLKRESIGMNKTKRSVLLAYQAGIWAALAL